MQDNEEVPEADANAIFSVLIIQNLLEALVATDTLTNADVVNVLVKTRRLATSLNTPAGEAAARMAYALDRPYREKALE